MECICALAHKTVSSSFKNACNDHDRTNKFLEYIISITIKLKHFCNTQKMYTKDKIYLKNNALHLLCNNDINMVFQDTYCSTTQWIRILISSYGFTVT